MLFKTYFLCLYHVSCVFTMTRSSSSFVSYSTVRPQSATQSSPSATTSASQWTNYTIIEVFCSNLQPNKYTDREEVSRSDLLSSTWASSLDTFRRPVQPYLYMRLFHIWFAQPWCHMRYASFHLSSSSDYHRVLLQLKPLPSVLIFASILKWSNKAATGLYAKIHWTWFSCGW